MEMKSSRRLEGEKGMIYERRSFPVQELRVVDTPAGKQISWFPALFGSRSGDLGGFYETIKPSAFNKTIQEADVRALFNHNPDYVLGRNTAGTLDLSVTRKGLRASVNPPDTAWANDLMVSIERGDISGGSFGFQVIKDDWGMDEEKNVTRELQEVKLFDVSLVTYPAYPETNGSVALRSAMLANGLDDERFTQILLQRAANALVDEDCAELRQMIQNLVPEPLQHSAPDLSMYRLRTELARLRR
mgnify:CR=1 FL=1